MFRCSVIVIALAGLACGSSAPVAAADPQPAPGAAVSAAQSPVQASPEAPPATVTESNTPASSSSDGTPHSAREGESREAMLRRFGLTEDPGLDPDAAKVWTRPNGTLAQIHKYKASEGSYVDQEPGFVRPFGWGNFSREIFQLNSEWIWVFEPVEIVDGEVLPAAEALMRRMRTRREEHPMEVKRELAVARGWNEEQIGYVEAMRSDFELLDPPTVDRTVRFRNSSSGLPQTGSWRNSGVFADVNRDGRMDVVVPPPRGGAINAVPMIFLGDGKGNWADWVDASFPVGINYGSVVAADLNKDGHPDIVSGIHLTGVGIYINNGAGYFNDVTPKMERQFDTRRAIVTDLNADGHLDVAAVSEGPALFQNSTRSTQIHPSHVIGFINDGTGRKWRQVDIAEEGRTTSSDWLVAADLNGDRYPDLASGSFYFGGPDVMYMSEGPLAWSGFGRGFMPFHSYYGSVVAGKFIEDSKTDQIVSAFARTWPRRAPLEPPARPHASGLELVSWDESGKPSRRSLVRTSTRAVIRAMAAADFDMDGHLDVLYLQPDPREFIILLGDGRGGFAKGKVEGLTAVTNAIYDLSVGDANEDGRPDLLLLYEREAAEHGSVQVWVNEK